MHKVGQNWPDWGFAKEFIKLAILIDFSDTLEIGKKLQLHLLPWKIHHRLALL